jgi:hypothetical protein
MRKGNDLTFRALAAAVLLFAAAAMHAQNSQATWVFGDNYVLQWKQGGQISRDPVFIQRPPLRSAEGAASISDSCSGDLLYQSDGLQIWYGNGSLVPGSQGLCSGTSSRQNVVFVPWKGHPGATFVFAALSTTGPGVDPIATGADCIRTYTYSLIEEQANGTFALTRKNVPLTPSRAPYGSEMIAATATRERDGYWVLTFDPYPQEILAYRVDSSGVNPIPVISKVNGISSLSQMQVSPDGKRVAMNSVFGSVFDFDNATGRLSAQRDIDNYDIRSRFYQQVYEGLGVSLCYGTCFSPDSKQLYLSQQTSRTKQGVVTYINRILQFDLTLPTASDVANSVEVIFETAEPSKQVGYISAQMNLGIDRRLWINMDSVLDVIEYPNIRGKGCVYKADMIAIPYSPLLKNERGISFPTIINSDLFPIPGQQSCRPPWPELVGDTICAGECVTMRVRSQHEVHTCSWSAAGSNQGTSRGADSAVFCYDQPGTYVVYANVGNEYGSNVAVARVVVNAKPVVSLNVDTLVCRGEVVTARASGAASYEWLSPKGLSNSTAPVQTLVMADSAVAFVVVATSEFGCSDTAEVIVRSTDIDVTLTGDTVLCFGEPATIRASGAVSYMWSGLPTGAIFAGDSAVFTATSNTVLVVVGTDPALPCADTAQITISVSPLPNVRASGDTTVCPGVPVALSASGAASYQWTPQAVLDDPTNASPVARVSATTLFVVVGTDIYGCVSSDTVLVSVSSQGSVQLDSDTVICSGQTVELRARSTSTDVEWIDLVSGSVVGAGEVLQLTPSTTTSLLARLRAESCSVSDTIIITVVPPVAIVALPDTAICEGGTVTLGSSAGDATQWYGASGEFLGNGAKLVQQPASTTIYVATAPCSEPDTVRVVVRPFDASTVSVGSTSVEVGTLFDVPFTVGSQGSGEREFQLSYDGRVMSIDAIQPGQVLSSSGIGTQTSVTIVSIPDATLATHVIYGRTYLAPVSTTQIVPSSREQDTCFRVNAIPGVLSVTGCALDARGGILFDTQGIAVSYSPSERSLTISGLDIKDHGPAHIAVSSLVGSRVVDVQLTLSEGQASVIIPLEQIANGLYSVIVIHNEVVRSAIVCVY